MLRREGVQASLITLDFYYIHFALRLTCTIFAQLNWLKIGAWQQKRFR